ncbi:MULTISPECIES: CoxG family protein [unclassified Lentilitoribacter]|uniref:CoxG family protein n=1 Tax=unclassified Lentilitoribacter TaxID=2647570 RepID=UPI0013A69E54|nr:carbon monoxide dehydrogenase subunit G [Lentilitoribacter sp. Alg239-R112]
MELQDEIFINAPRDVVYAALNDPEILKQCIPGCEELVKESDTELTAKVVLKVGPVKAKFSGEVNLDGSGAPDTFSLVGKGNGGVAGYAKGGADVELVEQDDGTMLKYMAKAEIGGKLAQLGSRLVSSTAKKLSKNFFDNFEKVVCGDPEDDQDEKKGFWGKLVSS